MSTVVDFVEQEMEMSFIFLKFHFTLKLLTTFWCCLLGLTDDLRKRWSAFVSETLAELNKQNSTEFVSW